MTTRPGFSLAELIVTLTATTLIVAVLVGVLVAQLRLGNAIALRSGGNDAMRSAVAVLTGEVRRGTLTDVRALSADSLSLRAFRGTGIICAAGAAGILVRYRGDRLPNADKDSALVVRGDSSRVFRVVEAHSVSGGCSAEGEESIVAMQISSTAVPRDGVVLIFESGSYYLTTRALRYRIGAEGRQPLTAEFFNDAVTQFLPATGMLGPRFTLGLKDTRSATIATSPSR